MVARSSQMVRSIKEAIIIGCGSMGKRHAQNLVQYGVKPTAFADPTFAGMKQGTHVYPDAMKCIQEQAGDRLVVIASPTYLHAEQAIEAIVSGARALYIEKPLAVNDKDAYHILEASDTHNVKVVVGYNFRYHAGIHSMIENIIQPNFWLNAIGIDDITTWPSHKRLGLDSYLHTETGGLLWTSSAHAIDIAIFLHGEVGEVLAGRDKAKSSVVLRLHHVGGGVSVLYNKWAEGHPQASLLSYMSPSDAIVVDLLNKQPHDMHAQIMYHALEYFSKDILHPDLPTLSDAVHGVSVLVSSEESLRNGKVEAV